MESEERMVPPSGEIMETFSERADEFVGVHDPGVTSIIYVPLSEVLTRSPTLTSIFPSLVKDNPFEKVFLPASPLVKV
jgi:hypothetical protein